MLPGTNKCVTLPDIDVPTQTPNGIYSSLLNGSTIVLAECIDGGVSEQNWILEDTRDPFNVHL